MNPARIALSRINFLAFTKATHPGYQIGWVHREIAARLQNFLADVSEKRSPRLILTMPPRHGKSELVSRRFPAWALGVNPDLSIIAASYSDDLARRMNKDVQRIMDSPDYTEIFPGTDLSRSRTCSSLRTSGLFEIPGHSGNYRSTGVGGGITGMGADILVIDDPLKDRASADSPTIRSRVWDWYTSTAYTRLSPGGGVLVTVTRWHEDDLAGRLLSAMTQEGGDRWTVVNYPAIAEKDELHRKAGEALHPERYPLESLERIRANVGGYDWSALYQQHPTPRAGGIFKRDWVRRYENAPTVFDRVVQSWDLTFKDAETGDFVAGLVLGQIGADIYVLDCVHERVDFVGQIRAILRMTAKWPQATAKVVEDKANGPAVIAALRSKVPGIVAFNPQGNKVQRANSAAPVVESGNLLLPKDAPWLRDFEAELFTFPGAEHDDMVDALDQGIIYLTQRATRGIAAWL